MIDPVLRGPACAALRLSCHPERSEGSASCFTPCLGSASIRPIAIDNCLIRVDCGFRAHNDASRSRSQSATGVKLEPPLHQIYTSRVRPTCEGPFGTGR